VDFLGFQINPWPYFYCADVFVLPSRFEGMPNALLEALALGTPAVATNSVEAMREIHATNENMVLVPPDDPGALAEGINSLLLRPKLERDLPESPTRRMDKFDLQRAVSEYSRLF
jgi:glycosyltransferase involved in cell wall biosynthesis